VSKLLDNKPLKARVQYSCNKAHRVYQKFISGEIDTEGTTDFTDATDWDGSVSSRRIREIRGSFFFNLLNHWDK
jgi:hypothetical protein